MHVGITKRFLENADSDLVGLGWSLRLYICNKLPCDAEAASTKPTL